MSRVVTVASSARTADAPRNADSVAVAIPANVMLLFIVPSCGGRFETVYIDLSSRLVFSRACRASERHQHHTRVLASAFVGGPQIAADPRRSRSARMQARRGSAAAKRTPGDR